MPLIYDASIEGPWSGEGIPGNKQQETARPWTSPAKQPERPRPWSVGVIPGTRQPDRPPIHETGARPWTTPQNRPRPIQQRGELKPRRAASKWFEAPAWLSEKYWFEKRGWKRPKAWIPERIYSKGGERSKLTSRLKRSSPNNSSQMRFMTQVAPCSMMEYAYAGGATATSHASESIRRENNYTTNCNVPMLLNSNSAARHGLEEDVSTTLASASLQEPSSDGPLIKSDSFARVSIADGHKCKRPPSIPGHPFAENVYFRRANREKIHTASYENLALIHMANYIGAEHTCSSSSLASPEGRRQKHPGNAKPKTTTVVLGGLSLKLTTSSSGKTVQAKCLPDDPNAVKNQKNVGFSEEEDEKAQRPSVHRADRGMAARLSLFARTDASELAESLGALNNNSEGDDASSSSAVSTKQQPGAGNTGANPQRGAGEKNADGTQSNSTLETFRPSHDEPKKVKHDENNPKTREECCLDAFRKLQDDHQLHRDDLPRALELAGITNPTLEWVDEVFEALSKFSTCGEHEFLRFVAGYIERQHQAYAEAFEKCDSDGSGYVEKEELAALLRELGVEPMRHVLEEVITEVDEDGEGSLDLDEFMKVMDIIRDRECFTKREYDEFKTVYHRFDQDGSGDMDTKELMHLLNWLGYAMTNEETQEVVNEVDIDGTGTVNEREFLICMRKVREREVRQIKDAIAQTDKDGNGTISGTELDSTMRTLGYVTDPEAVSDAMANAGLDRNNDDLDLSDFFLFLNVYRQREGLSATDVAEVEQAFDFYDRGNVGEVSTLDIGKILRWLGYPIPFDQQQAFVTKVDVDRSGKLQLPLLKKMVRMYREMEMEAMRDAYDDQVEVSGPLNITTVTLAVQRIEFMGGFRPEIVLDSEELNEEPEIDFLRFVYLVGRALRASRKTYREDGGFTKSEVKELRKQFDVFDQDGSGDISNKELIKVIEVLFPHVANDVSMRPKLLELMADADRDGTGNLYFTDFLQLMRQFRDLQDRESAAKEQQAIEETSLTQQEVNEYREVFLAASVTHGTRITLDEMKSMISAVCPLGDRNAKELTELFHSVTGKKSHSPPDEADFAEFLLIIRVLLDKNFAQINERTSGESLSNRVSAHKSGH